MFEDRQGGVVVDQGVQAVAGRVLELVLPRDRLGQIRVVQHVTSYVEKAGGEFGGGLGEELLGLWRRAVDHDPGWQHELQRRERVIGVAFDATAHPAGVVGDDSAHRAGRQTGRIGADLGAVSSKGDVNDGTDRARESADPSTVVLDRDAAPMPLHLTQDSLGLCLPGQAGAGSAEGDRRTPTMTDRENGLDVGNRGRHHHDLRTKKVRRGVAGELRDRHGVIQNPIGGDLHP